MKYTIENNLESKTYLEVFKRNLGKMFIVFLALVFSFTSIQAMQTKIDEPRKKKVVKQKKYKHNIRKNKKMPENI